MNLNAPKVIIVIFAILFLLSVIFIISKINLVFAESCSEEEFSEIQNSRSTIPYKSISEIIQEYEARGYKADEAHNNRLLHLGLLCEGEDCGDSVILDKTCNDGQKESISFVVACRARGVPPLYKCDNKSCYKVVEKVLQSEGNGGLCKENTNICILPVDEEQKRQAIFQELGNKYKFKVADTNVCGQLADCGNNPPWPADDLNNLKNFLDQMPACFINNLNLNQIAGVQWAPQVENNWDPNSLGQRISKNICCSQEAKNNCSVAHYWGQGYNNITVCGDMYKNGVDDQGRACKQFFSLEGVLAHEMTHALQFNALGVVIQPQIYGTVLMISWMNKTGWTTNWKVGTFCLPMLGCNFVPPTDLPSNYAKSSNDPAEDMAESVRLYYENPDLLKQISQRRYDFVKNNIMCGKEFTK